MKKNKPIKFYVSRQLSWPDGKHQVEIVAGGRDYANPGQLNVKFRSLGEGEEYYNPREAAYAAIEIKTAWKKEIHKNIDLTFGSTGGFTYELPTYTARNLLKRAKELFCRLTKCDQCGHLMGEESFTHDLVMDNENFCSSNCAETDYQNQIKDDSEE